MKILYKQSAKDENSSLNRFGIHNCYLKQLSFERDCSSITKKSHHHTGFEMHIVTDGYQEYGIEGVTHRLESGCFLVIYPSVKHTVIGSAPHTRKFSITFNKPTKEHLGCFFGTLTERMSDNIAFISNEASLKKEISSTLIENNILEIIVSAFRLSGVKENDKAPQKDENTIISLAKRFIDDNIETAPSVTDVAEYCHLSAKQLTRIFRRSEDVSPGEYIINRRISAIENLLSDYSFSLKQISETMSFNNEYYFNAFFSKHSGMTPGEFRKMLGKQTFNR